MSNFNFNKVIIGGRLTSDPQQKQTQSGLSVATFTVAVNRKGKDQTTDFINCTAWRQTADFITRYFKKGNSICVVGQLQTSSYEKNGQKVYKTDVLVDEALFVDSKGDATPGVPEYTPMGITPNFEEIETDEDLPF